MRKDWEIKKLGEVCEIVNGGTPKSKVSEYWNGNRQWITPKDMGMLESKFVYETSRKITQLGLENSSAKLLPKGSVILSSRAPIGYLAINKIDMATNQGCKGLVPSKEISSNFLYHFLSSKKEMLNSLGTGATFRELSSTTLSGVKLYIPTLPEQKEIVRILDEAFEKIGRAREVTEKNLKNSKELFDSYLNKIFIEKGKDWEEKKLGGVGVVQTGNTPKTGEKENFGNYIPFIKPGDFYKNGSLNCNNNGLSKIGSEKSRLINENSVLMVCIGATIGKTGFAEKAITCNQQINSLTLSLEHYPKFFYYAMLTNDFQNRVIGSSGQATLPIINKTKWSNLKVTFPHIKEQQKQIVKKLDQLSEQTKKLEALYEKKLNDLDELKKSILEKAFSGELTKDYAKSKIKKAV